jgi:hypothetical protein
MSITRIRLLVLVAVWFAFVVALNAGVPARGHPMRPLLWVTIVLVSLRVIYGAVRSQTRRS